MDKLKSEIKSRLFITLMVTAFLISILAHGMALFNKYSFHDDAFYFNDIGATFSSGRWMLGILKYVTEFFFDGKMVSTSLINGFITSGLIAITVFIIVRKVHIKSIFLAALALCIIISSTPVTGIMAYMFTAPYYYLGVLMGVWGAYFFYKKKTIISGIVCVLLMACGVGIYQANIPVFLCTLLMFMLSEVYKSELKWKQFFKLVFQNIVICVGFLAVYVIVNNVALNIVGCQLTDYRGINDYGMTGVGGYLKRVLVAYREFISPSIGTTSTLYPGFSSFVYVAIIILSVFLMLKKITENKERNKAKCIEIAILVLVYPLASNFIYVMVTEDDVHELMTFGVTFSYILLIWFIDKMVSLEKKEQNIRRAIISLMVVLLIMNIRYSNMCHLKAEIMQSQAISYYNSLISNIQQVDGYDSKLPVVYINERNKDTNVVSGSDYLFDRIPIWPYDLNTLINNYSWKEMMSMWCGYSPNLVDFNDIDMTYEIADMPCYPSDGSIKKVGRQIVVKFSD